MSSLEPRLWGRPNLDEKPIDGQRHSHNLMRNGDVSKSMTALPRGKSWKARSCGGRYLYLSARGIMGMEAEGDPRFRDHVSGQLREISRVQDDDKGPVAIQGSHHRDQEDTIILRLTSRISDEDRLGTHVGVVFSIPDNVCPVSHVRLDYLETTSVQRRDKLPLQHSFRLVESVHLSRRRSCTPSCCTPRSCSEGIPWLKMSPSYWIANGLRSSQILLSVTWTLPSAINSALHVPAKEQFSRRLSPTFAPLGTTRGTIILER